MIGELVKWDTPYKAFEEIEKTFPERAAMIYLGCNYTYAELKEAAIRFASSLYNAPAGSNSNHKTD